MPVRDWWDRDQWGRLVPGSCTRYGPSITTASTTPSNGYVTEDKSLFYVAEDGITFYVQEP